MLVPKGTGEQGNVVTFEALILSYFLTFWKKITYNTKTTDARNKIIASWPLTLPRVPGRYLPAGTATQG